MQLAQIKADIDNVGESLENVEIKKINPEKENKNKVYVCNICGIFFMYKECIFDQVLNIHNNCTICNIQFNDSKLLILNFLVKQ